MDVIKLVCDKKLHFIAGFVIAFTFGFFINSLLGYFLSSVIGVAKEIWDKHGHGTPDLWDLIYTMFGGFIGMLMSFAIKIIM